MITDPSKTSMKITTKDLENILGHHKNENTELYKTTFDQPFRATNEQIENTDETVNHIANTEKV